MPHEPISERDEALASRVVDAGFHVHKTLGSGLLESVYEECLCYELTKREIKFERQKSLPIVYDGVTISTKLVLAVLVDDRLAIELKAVDRLQPIHDAQLLTYLKLANKRLGFLMNFNSTLFRDGVKRLVV